MEKKPACLFVLVSIMVSSIIAVQPVYTTSSASYSPKAPMRQARNCRVAVANEKIYAIGGNNLGSNEEYDPANDTWAFKAPMPNPRDSFGITTYENKIYCIGGRNATGVTGANEVYDPVKDSWENKAPMLTPRADLQANVVNGKIYLIGGVADNYALTLNEVYDPETDSWTTKAPMPTVNFTILAASDYASAAVGNKIYIIGGFYVHGIKGAIRMLASNLNQIYNTENDSWSLGAPAPSPTAYASAGATTGTNAPNQIYVFGADTEWPFWMLTLRGFTAQSYDPKTNSWTVCTSMPTERVDAAVAVVNDKLYVIGGYTMEKHVDSFFPSTSSSAVNEQYTPFGYGAVPPVVLVVSPENRTYNVSSVPLAFTVNKIASWIGYSLDGQEEVAVSGNTTLTGLANGVHNLTVYVNDTFENAGASETLNFSIAVPSSPFSTAWITAVAVIVTFVGVALLVYFKKRNH